MTTEIPQPPAQQIVGLQPISEVKSDLLRIGLQGPPNSGKTFAGATFPNPIFIDLDNKLRGLAARKDIGRIPFCDVKFMNEYNKGLFKAPTLFVPPNRRDAIKHWLRSEGGKLNPTQTLIIDSWTSLMNYADQQAASKPEYTKSGEVDKYAFYRNKLEFCIEMVELLKGLTCNVVVTCHETIDREPDGTPNGKLRPLVSGQFADQFAGHFTDWYRQIIVERTNEKTKQTNVINGKPVTEDVSWWWQVKTDGMFTACCSLQLPPDIKYIKADYSSLVSTTKISS